MAYVSSAAVMARRVEPKDSLDYFPTPPWATRALIEHVIGAFLSSGLTCWEPACGEGHMSKTLLESNCFSRVCSSDIFDYGYGRVEDFLSPEASGSYDWVITNPPFNKAADFVKKGLDVANTGVAVLVRTAFLEGKSRYKDLFSKNPPSIVAPFVERVSMAKGKVVNKGCSATSFSWMVWLKSNSKLETRVVWIPPCKKELERNSDYEGEI